MVVLISIVLVGVFAMIVWACVAEYLARRKTRDNPHAKLQSIISVENQKLAQANKSLLESEQYVRQLQRKKDALQSDVDTLKNTIKSHLSKCDSVSLVQSSAVTLNLTESLMAKEQELAACNADLVTTIAQHEQHAKIINQFRRHKRQMEQEAQKLQVNQNLAEMQQHAAELSLELNTSLDTTGYQAAKNAIESQIAEKTSIAAVDSELAGSGVSSQEVEDRLKQLRQECAVSNGPFSYNGPGK